MCDPILIAGLALEAGSVAANTIASNSDAQARASVLHNEITRNQKLDQQAAAINTKAAADYASFVPQQDARAQQLGDYFNSDTSAKPDLATSGVMPTSSDDVVNQDTAKQLGKADAFATQQGVSLGDLRSFGDLLADKTRDQAQGATAVGQIGNDETGFANNVLPYQLTAASHAGDTTRTIGDLLALGGSVATGVGGLKAAPSLSSLYGIVPAATRPSLYPLGGVY